MASVRETILAALHARLSALSATALRGEALPEQIPAAGLLIAANWMRCDADGWDQLKESLVNSV